MEAVPRLPMIHFELSTSPENAEFGPKLKQCIRDHYHENPETYINEIFNIESLRSAAVYPQRDVEGCSTLKRYYCQLHFLQNRFPMSKDGEAAVNFTWIDLYANVQTCLADIRYEMVNILYNIGALHSQLGASDSRGSEDGLKLACTHFQCAAWAFQHIKDSYPQMPGVNVAPNVVQFKHQMCLAQAQECILEKSMADNRKAAINAKVAVQVVDYYNMAMSIISSLEDECSVMYSIGSKHLKRWRRYVKFKSAYYACISLLYQGMQSEEQQKMGERVAYYQAAFDKLQEALNLSKDIENQEIVHEALTFTMDVVGGKKKAAKSENDLIYHEKVPDREALPDVKGKSLVRGIAFNVNDPEISGPDIFAKLVPLKAHEASSMYSEEKAKLLRKVSANIDKKDEQLISFMSALQLDYLNIFSQMGKIPQELVDRCAAMTEKSDAIQNLISSMGFLAEVSVEVDAMLHDISELIKAEEIAEKEYQEVMGSRPPSIVATDLTREANKYQEAHKKASDSNETLHKAMTLHITNLKVLMLPLEELQQQIPTLPPLDRDEEVALKELQLLVNKVDEMKRQRSMLNNQLREAICNDDITNILIIKQNEGIESIFAEELKKHDKIIQLIEQNLFAQENILKALTDVYAQFAPTRKRINDIVRKRNAMVSALMSSYDAYEDLLAKSRKGLEFYRKLENNVSKLLQRCKGTCKVQEEEREQILIKNGKFKPKSSFDKTDPPVSNQNLKLKDYLHSMKKSNYSAAVSNPNLNQNSYYNQNLYHATTDISSGMTMQPNTYIDQSLTIPSSDTKPQWVPSVRPTPLGSEGTNPVSQLPEMRMDYIPPDQLGYQNPMTSTYPPYSQPYSYDSNKYQYSQPPKPNLPVNYSTPATPDIYQNEHNPGVPGNPLPQGGEITNPSNTIPSYPNQPTLNPNNQVNDQSKMVNNPAPTQIPYPNYGGVQNSTPLQYPQYPTSSQNFDPSLAQSQKNYPYPETSIQPAVYNPAHSTVAATSSIGEASYTYPNNAMYSSATNPNDVYIPNHYYDLNNPYLSLNKYPNYETNSNPNDPNYPKVYNTQQNPCELQNVPNQSGYDFNVPATVTTSLTYPVSGYTNEYYPSNPNAMLQAGMAQAGMAQAGASNGNQMYSQTPMYSYSMDQSQQFVNPQFSTPFSTTEFMFMNSQQSSGFYTNAGQYVTLHTNSSQTSIEGTTFASQYSENYPPPKNDVSYNIQSYYNIPYGYQPQPPSQDNISREPELTPTPLPSEVVSTEQNVPQSPLTPQNTMVYMQARTSNSGTTLTYTKKVDSVSNYSDAQSNVDLLAGLDFNISQAPLIPTSSKSEVIANETVISEAVNDRQKMSISEMNDQMASLNLQPNLSKVQENINKFPNQIFSSIAPMNDEKMLGTKIPPKDPLDDPDVANQLKQDVEKFEKFVEGLTAKTLNGPTSLDIKWKELLDLQEKSISKHSISVARCYPMKNRFSDILPYDGTRVELPSTKDDYINASLVKNVSALCPPAILTQAPLPATYADFWTMVWEQQVELIICLLTNSELEDQIYWPAEKGVELNFGRMKLTLQSCNNRNQWIERIILITDHVKASSRNIVHLQLCNWPGSSFPASPGPFLSVVCESLNLYRQQRNLSHCMVVHCLSGVGRSGLFLLVLAAVTEINAGQGIPDLISLAGKMSMFRKNCLRDREHLKFAYQTVLYYAQDLLMKRGILTSRPAFEEKRKSHTRHPSEDFLLGPPKSASPCPSNVSTNSSDEARDTVEMISSSAVVVDINKQDGQRAISSEENKRRNLEVFKNTGTLNSSNQSNDPLSQIDPLWSLKKESEN